MTGVRESYLDVRAAGISHDMLREQEPDESICEIRAFVLRLISEKIRISLQAGVCIFSENVACRSRGVCLYSQA